VPGREQDARQSVPPEARRAERAGGDEDGRGHVVPLQQGACGLEVVGIAVVERDDHGVAQHPSVAEGGGQIAEADRPSEAPNDGQVLGEMRGADAEPPRVHRRHGDAMVEQDERPRWPAPHEAARPRAQVLDETHGHARPPPFTTRAVINIS
jgi:hypothetical protein